MGNDLVDTADFVYWSGHGGSLLFQPWGAIRFFRAEGTPNDPVEPVSIFSMQLGDIDLEWVAFDTCEFPAWRVLTESELGELQFQFRNAHMVLGWVTVKDHKNSERNLFLAKKLLIDKKKPDGTRYTIWEAWQAVRNKYQPEAIASMYAPIGWEDEKLPKPGDNEIKPDPHPSVPWKQYWTIP